MNKSENTTDTRPTLLHFVYENTHSAAGGTLRAKDIAEIAVEQDVKGFRVDRMKLRGTHGGYNINVTVDDPRFHSHQEAHDFFRPFCMAKRRLRRDIKEAKEAKRATIATAKVAK